MFLHTLLRALPRDRFRALEKFVRSPYHVTHRGVSDLLERMKGRLDSDIEKDVLRKEVGPDDPRRLYHLSNYLLESVESFLAIEGLKAQEHLCHAETIAALRKLQLPDAASGMLRYARKRLDSDPRRGLEYLQADHRLHAEAYYLSLQQGRAKVFNAQELSDTQDIAFICDKLRTGCLLLSHESVSKQVYDKGLLENVLKYLEGHRYLEIPAIAVYYHGYYAQLGAEDHFTRLKNLLQQYAPLFSLAEIHDLYLMAINFCIRKINRQEERFFREIFELYQSGLRHGALLEDGVLSRWTFNNITATGLRLREFDWVRTFLDDYAPLLPEEHREGAMHYNLARYHYEKGEYKEAMLRLMQIEYDDVLQNLTAKTMLSKIYFVLRESDALENQLDSIRIYIRRKKVLGYHRENYLAFVKLMRKLLMLNPNDPHEKGRLRLEIEAEPVLTEREWLLSNL